MGIIAVGTNDDKEVSGNKIRIKRVKSFLKASKLTSEPKISILLYETPDTVTLSKISFKLMIELQPIITFSLSLGIDLLW